eukprot:TRINITY_DN9691_c0_g1_i1.p1 TRINITY_DN9691_c0_g1~~TRINITY_DN9691_c0_g1_i1.p1  ORF type:complete len:320 (-),score=47.69 TRINITY_DN9691_c0_g1_i1:124-1083(-)
MKKHNPSELKGDAIERFLSVLPDVDFAVAYGSGAIPQHGYSQSEKPPMVDYILGVSDPCDWHRHNIQRNPSHYSALRYLGASAVTAIQNTSAGIYFNPFVRGVGNMEAKYGVISVDRLMDDLTAWSSLYVSGRLHKPVRLLSSLPSIDEAMRVNCAHAVNVAMLLLPETFSDRELYHQIAALSYLGDIRMGIAENPLKVDNIVNANLPRFRDLYSEVLRGVQADALSHNNDYTQFTKNISTEATARLVRTLPSGLLAGMGTLDEPLAPAQVDSLLRGAISRKVATFSRSQTLKGVWSAGLVRSATYGVQKLMKFARAAR